jgi:hypothetical protein
MLALIKSRSHLNSNPKHQNPLPRSRPIAFQGECDSKVPKKLLKALDKGIPLAPLRPRQCLLLTASPLLSVDTAPARFWLDNLYIRYRAEFTFRNPTFFLRASQLSLGGLDHTDAYVTRCTIQDGVNAGNGFNIGTSGFALFHGMWRSNHNVGALLM